MLPLSDKAFYALALVWFALIAVAPRGTILALSLGQSRVGDTGAKALRWLGRFFALVALGNLAWLFIR